MNVSVGRKALDEAIARVDRAIERSLSSAPNGDEATRDSEAWVICRRELRMRRAQSERTLPAAASAAQHFSAAQRELEIGMEHLGGVAQPPREDDEG